MRRMALSTLVNTTGNGIFFTLSALYFTRIVGFSVVQVGAILLGAALATRPAVAWAVRSNAEREARGLATGQSWA